MEKIKKRIIATSKSKHSGMEGEVVADNGLYYMARPIDQTYTLCYNNSSYDFKVCQVYKRYCKELKDDA